MQDLGSIPLAYLNYQKQRFVEYVLLLEVDEKSLELHSKEWNVTPLQTLFPVCLASKIPSTDHPDHSLEGQWPLFVFPSGLTLSNECFEPSFHSFVLTQQNGTKLFGFCWTKYHSLADEKSQTIKKLIQQQFQKTSLPYDEKKFFLPQSICIFSFQPFHKTFQSYFQNDSVLQNSKILDNSVCSNIYKRFSSIPWPEGSKNQNPNALPYCDIDFSHLFSCLNPDNILKLLNAILCERKIIIIASKKYLTQAFEALSVLLYPLFWPHVYIPLLPGDLVDYLQIPFPFLIGLDKSSVESLPQDSIPTGEVILVYLESNKLLASQPLQFEFPPRHKEKLYRVLNHYAVCCLYPNIPQETIDVHLSSSESSGEEEDLKMIYSEELGWHLSTVGSNNTASSQTRFKDENPLSTLREGCLSVFVSLFKHFKAHVRVPSENSHMNSGNLFNTPEFLAEVDKSCLTFMEKFTRSQLFSWFIQDRLIRQEDDIFDQKVNSALGREIERDVRLRKKDLEGLLMCRVDVSTSGYSLKSWKRRLVKLAGNKLELITTQLSASSLNLKLKTTFSPQVTDTIVLDQHETRVSIVPVDAAPTKYTFEISNSTKELVFSADDERSRRKWVRLLKARTRNRDSNKSIRVKRQTVAFKSITDHMKRVTVVLDFGSQSSKIDLSKNSRESVKSLTQILQRSSVIQKDPELEQIQKSSSKLIEECLTIIEKINSNLNGSLSIEELVWVGKCIKIVQTILETKANQGAQNYALPPYPIKKDSLQQKSKSKVDIFTLIDAINTVTQEIQKVLQSMLVTLTKAKREDALPISKLVTQIVTVIKYLFDYFKSMAPTSLNPLDSAKKEALESNQQALKLFQQLQTNLRESKSIEETLFLAILARNIKKFLNENNMDISQLIVKKRKIEHSNVDKLQPLKEAALIGFDSIISRITKSQTEIKLATSEEQLQSLSKQFHDINSIYLKSIEEH